MQDRNIVISASTVNDVNNKLTVVVCNADLLLQSLEDGTFSLLDAKEKLTAIRATGMQASKCMQ